MQFLSVFAILMICGLCTALPQFFPQDFNEQFAQQQFPQQQFAQQQFPQQQFAQQQFPQQQRQQQQQQPTQAPAVTTTTTASPAFFACYNTCPTTSEYNPVCGSDATNYHNDQKLMCTNICGRRVNPNWTSVTATRRGVCQPL